MTLGNVFNNLFIKAVSQVNWNVGCPENHEIPYYHITCMVEPMKISLDHSELGKACTVFQSI